LKVKKIPMDGVDGFPYKAGLPTFSEATEMTGHTALFKADRLPTIRTGLSKQAILIFMMSFVAFILHIPLF
jgi:hypothetical protein